MPDKGQYDEGIQMESEFERDFHAYVILREKPGISWDEAKREASKEDFEMRKEDHAG